MAFGSKSFDYYLSFCPCRNGLANLAILKIVNALSQLWEDLISWLGFSYKNCRRKLAQTLLTPMMQRNELL